jgi:3-oxoacyl-[acyl-carrier protein] reductase
MEIMSGRLQDKIAVITGASAGIGQACARALMRDGASLVLTARRRDRLEELVREAKQLGLKAVFAVGDAREEETARRTAEEAVKAFGRIDILINNAGVGNYKNLVDTSAEEYAEMMDANMRSTFLFSRHVVPLMVKQKSGLVLMISSMAGVYGFAGEAAYCATKFAQVGFAQGSIKNFERTGLRWGRSILAASRRSSRSGKGVRRRASLSRGCSKPKTLLRRFCLRVPSRRARGLFRFRCGRWRSRWRRALAGIRGCDNEPLVMM